MERKQEQIDKQLTNDDTYPEKVRKKPLLTPKELDQFLDKYLQKIQSENADWKNRRATKGDSPDCSCLRSAGGQ